jgi:hypothetical protein
MHHTPSLIPTVNGHTVRSFSTHGHLSAAKGSSTTVSRSDIRLIQHFDFSAYGLVRRWLFIGYFLILYSPNRVGGVSYALVETTKGDGQELPARVLQRCLLALFRHPLIPLLP